MFTEAVHGTDIVQELEGDSWPEDMEEEKSSKLDTYRNSVRIYIAFVIGVGIVGNTACLWLYRRPPFCRYRSSRYLTALATADMTSLLCLGLVWLKGLGVRWQDGSDFVCASSIFVSNSATFLSAWFVMLLTADMVWTLRRPYRINMFDENKSIIFRILAVTFLGLVANSWTWSAAKIIYDEVTPPLTNQSSENLISIINSTDKVNGTVFAYRLHQNSVDVKSLLGACQLTFNDDEYFARCMTIFDMMISFTVPLVTTLILNGYIGYNLMSSARVRRRLSESLQSQSEFFLLDQNQNRKNILVTVSIPRNHTRPLIRQSECADIFAPMPLSINKTQLRRKKRNLFSGLGKEATVSSLLIAKSLTYLALNLPTHTYRFWTIFRDPSLVSTEADRESEFFVNMLVYMLFYTQFSLNFLLYSGHACKKKRGVAYR